MTVFPRMSSSTSLVTDIVGEVGASGTIGGARMRGDIAPADRDRLPPAFRIGEGGAIVFGKLIGCGNVKLVEIVLLMSPLL